MHDIHLQSVMCGEECQTLDADLHELWAEMTRVEEAGVSWDIIGTAVMNLRVILDDLDSYVLHLGGLVTLIKSRLAPDETQWQPPRYTRAEHDGDTDTQPSEDTDL